MNRRFGERFRQIAPDRGRIIAFLVLFVSCEAFMRCLDWIGFPIGARVPFRPANALLFLVAVSYGISRVTDLHPVFQDDYRTWLERTPWTNRKPLPLGPVELVLEDALVLGPLLLLSATLPQPRALSLLCAFLLCHLGAIVLSLWLTRIRTVGYLTAFGLGFAVKLWHQPLSCLAMATLVYLIAYEGLLQSLDRFPWPPRRRLKANNDRTGMGPTTEPCGWPYDRMLGEVVHSTEIPRIDAVICCALGSWWLYLLASFIPDDRTRLGMLSMVCSFPYVAFPFARLAFYTQGHPPPISGWARIMTMRWIIPGYDQVFAGPLCALLGGPASVGLLFAVGCPLDACIALGTGVTATVAFVAPPRLRRWRLTGYHRIVPRGNLTAVNTGFVKVV
jgi:hypothetical protein